MGRSIILWQWAILLLLLPLVLYPTGYHGLVLLAVPPLWIARKIINGYFFAPSPYNIAISALLIMTGVSVVVSFDIDLGLTKIIGLIFGIALFYAILDFGRNHSIWPIVGVYLLGGAILALIGLVGTVWLPPFDFLNGLRSLLPFDSLSVPGAVGGIINENELAGTLNWIAPLALACLIGLGKRLWKRKNSVFLFLLVTTLLTSFVLVATLSRGGALAFGMGVILVISFFTPPRWRLVLGIGFITALLVVVTYRFDPTGDDALGDTLGLAGRVEIWSRAVLAIGDFPVTGVGFNGFRRVVSVLYPLFITPIEIDLGHAHNHLLQTALDVGLPGLISYLAIWFISFGLLWATQRKLVRRGQSDHSYYVLVAGLAGSLLSGWVFGIFDAIALGSRPSFLWWMLLGLTGSVHYAVVFSAKRVRGRDEPERIAAPRPVVEETPVTLPIPTVTTRYTKRGRYSKE